MQAGSDPNPECDDTAKSSLSAGFLKKTLRAHGLSPNRRLGQHFLISPDVFSRIISAAAPEPGEVVLEVGTGVGRLTSLLADRAGHVVSVEIDAGLYRLASERLSNHENVTLLHCDMLESKHRIREEIMRTVRDLSGGDPIKVVANLPYQISSPAIINLLQWEQPLNSICVMVQREVAERLMAEAGEDQYGPLSVFAAYWSSVEQVCCVPQSAFWPQPEVGSAVVYLNCSREGALAEDYQTFTRVVNALFQSRRKMLRKALKQGWDKEISEKVLEKTGFDGRIRAEQLTPEEISAIANALSG